MRLLTAFTAESDTQYGMLGRRRRHHDRSDAAPLHPKQTRFWLSAAASVPDRGFRSVAGRRFGNDDPERACRPFDLNRERLRYRWRRSPDRTEHALPAALKIHAGLAGYAIPRMHHVTAPCPDGEGASAAPKLALKRAGMQPSDVAISSARHPPPLGDKAENTGGQRPCSAAAARTSDELHQVTTGHLMGAGGMMKPSPASRPSRKAFFAYPAWQARSGMRSGLCAEYRAQGEINYNEQFTARLRRTEFQPDCCQIRNNSCQEYAVSDYVSLKLRIFIYCK